MPDSFQGLVNTSNSKTKTKFITPPLNCSISLKNEPKEILRFESFPEEGISEGYAASWSTSRTAGRASRTIKGYYGGGDYRDFSLNLMFVAGLNLEGDIPTFSSSENTEEKYLDDELKKMETKIRWCEALCFAKPKQRRTAEQHKFLVSGDPPPVLITFGSFIVIEGQIRDFSVQWKQPFHPNSVRPYNASVNLTVLRVANFYPDFYDIKDGVSKLVSQPISSLEKITGINDFQTTETIQ